MTDDELDGPARPPFPAARIEAILADVDAGRTDEFSAFDAILFDLLGIERYRGSYVLRLDNVRAVSEDLRHGRISEAQAWQGVESVADIAYVQDSGGMLPPQDALSREQIERVLASLDGREQRVLRLRFGSDDGGVRTLEEVGREFGLTRGDIRQIEDQALRKLRHPSRTRKLRESAG